MRTGKHNGPLFVPLSRARLWALMKIHGLQTDLLDHERLVFPWDGLEYRFFLERERLNLESVVLRMDITLGPVRNWSAYDLHPS